MSEPFSYARMKGRHLPADGGGEMFTYLSEDNLWVGDTEYMDAGGLRKYIKPANPDSLIVLPNYIGSRKRGQGDA